MLAGLSDHDRQAVAEFGKTLTELIRKSDGSYAEKEKKRRSGLRPSKGGEGSRTANERPRRVQIKRTKGWSMPPNTVYVGRPSFWGNPYKAGKTTVSRKKACDAYRFFHLPKIRERLYELKGKNVGCWCPLDEPCHGDILLEECWLRTCP